MEKFIVNIKNINWIDKESSEAEVLFEINEMKFWAFSHPCDFIKEETVEVYFSFIEEELPENAFWDKNKERRKAIIPSENTRWGYYCFGRLKDIHPVNIDCGSFSLSFGDWINDETAVGSYVYFVIARLDISRK